MLGAFPGPPPGPQLSPGAWGAGPQVTALCPLRPWQGCPEPVCGSVFLRTEVSRPAGSQCTAPSHGSSGAGAAPRLCHRDRGLSAGTQPRALPSPLHPPGAARG